MQTNKGQQAGEKLIRVLAFTLVISVMNAFIFNVVLAQMSEQFKLTTSQISWVSSSYMLVYAIGSMIYGKLSDKYGMKQLLTIGLVVFAFGSVVGLSAGAYWMVIAARVLQAVGASVIPAAATIIPIKYFSPETRGRALGISAIGMAIGNAIAPVVSGLMMSFGHWRLLFCLPLLVLFTLPFYRKYLNDEPVSAGRMDYAGGGLLAGAGGLLLLAITNGGWETMSIGIVLLALFIVRICTAAEPFVQPRLFLNKRHVAGLVITTLFGGAVFALTFLPPLLLSGVNRIGPGIIGFVMVPGALASAMLGLKGGKLADRRGNLFLITSASALLFVSFGLMSSFAGAGAIVIAILLVFGNVGQTFMRIALFNTVSMSLAKEQTGVGMGLLGMLGFIATAAASAIFGKFIDIGSSMYWNPIHAYQGVAVYSNLFFLLAVTTAGLLLAYTLQFGRGAKKRLNPEVSSSISES